MLKEKIQSVQAALGEVLGNTKSEDDAELLRCCRLNLASIAEQAEALENNLNVVSVDFSAEEVEITAQSGPKVSMRDVKMSGILPIRHFKKALEEKCYVSHQA